MVFPDRARFMAYAARPMRGLIIDYARRRYAQRRGGLLELTSLQTTVADRLTDANELQQIRSYPLIFELFEQGAITLTAVRLLAPHVTAENHVAVLTSATHQSKRETSCEKSAPGWADSFRNEPIGPCGICINRLDSNEIPQFVGQFD